MAPARQGLIVLDHLHCFRDGEFGSAEPYLLTAFFKIDGDTNFIDVTDGQFFLNGPCTFVATPGTHGNLGDTAVDDGDDVPIPPALGTFDFMLRPIVEKPGFGEMTTGGAVGVVVALMEQDWISGDGAAAAHRRFNQELEKGINKLIPTFRKDVKEEPSPEDIEALKEQIFSAVRSAVIDAEGFWRFFPTLLNPDKLIGSEVFYTSDSEEIRARLQRKLTVEGPPPGQIVTHDYGVFGRIVVADQWLQVAGVTADGGMWHTIRKPLEWVGFGDVRSVAGHHAGAFAAMSCAGIRDQLHVCAVNTDGAMWHALRRGDGSWIGFGDFASQAGTHPGAFAASACAGIDDALHVCGVARDGAMWHALRRGDGSWIGWGDFASQAGTHPGSFAAVSCAGIGDELHVCGVARNGAMWHALRRGDGSWIGWGDFASQAGTHPGSFAAVSCAGIGDELHVCGVARNGAMWHALRRGDGSWIGWGDVGSEAGTHPGAFSTVSCVGVGEELHVCGTTRVGGMWHAIRERRKWIGFGDVKGEAGAHPGAFTVVGCGLLSPNLRATPAAVSDGASLETAATLK